MIVAALVMGLALIGGEADPGRQFDLVCTETLAKGRPSTPTYRFRIDLDQNRWCEGDCMAPREIAAVTADRYTLVDNEFRGRGLRTTNLNFIDRLTGQHSEMTIARGGLSQVTERQGRCERQPFSGMPQPRL